MMGAGREKGAFVGDISEAQWRRQHAANMKRRRRLNSAGQTVWYYFWVDPHTGREFSLKTDFPQALAAARALNAKRLSDPVQELVHRIQRPDCTWGDHLAWYDEEVLQTWRHQKTGIPMSRKALQMRQGYLRTMRDALGAKRAVSEITRAEFVAFLDTLSPGQHNVYRSLAHRVMTHAAARGLRDDNPIELTIKKTVHVKRQRLPREAFDLIREAAEPWFQRALDLALWSLQRREDLTLLRADQHWQGGKLYIRQGKGKGKSVGRLAITPGPKLKAAVIACLNAGDCPLLLWRVPERVIDAKWKQHPWQLSPRMLSDEFARLRDTITKDGKPYFADMDPEQYPTFHEIRSLGADTYREMGWAEEKIQALLGHTTQTMTRHYLDGHGERWDEVQAA